MMSNNTPEREREIAQGLRDATGALIGGLDVLDYNKGHEDYDAGTLPPRLTSTSYDLGRRRASERAELKADVMAKLKADQERGDRAFRELLADRPDILAQYDAQMAKMGEKSAPTPPTEPAASGG